MIKSLKSYVEIISLLILFEITTLAGWFPNSSLIGDRVRIRSGPSTKAKILGIARKGCEFDLAYVKGEWGRVVKYDRHDFIDISFPKNGPSAHPHVGWIHIKHIKYGHLDGFFENKRLCENMALKKEYREKYIGLLKQVETEDSKTVLDILKDEKFLKVTGVESGILLSNLRDEYVEKLVNLLSSKDESLTWRVKQMLLSPSLQGLAYERIKKIGPIRDKPVFRLNSIDFLYRLAEYKGYPVDCMCFIDALDDPIKEIRNTASLYFCRYCATGTEEIMNIKDVKKLIKLYSTAIEDAKSRIRFVIDAQVDRIYRCGLTEQKNNKIKNAIVYYKQFLDLMDFAIQNSYKSKSYFFDTYNKIPEIRKLIKDR